MGSKERASTLHGSVRKSTECPLANRRFVTLVRSQIRLEKLDLTRPSRGRSEGDPFVENRFKGGIARRFFDVHLKLLFGTLVVGRFPLGQRTG